MGRLKMFEAVLKRLLLTKRLATEPRETTIEREARCVDVVNVTMDFHTEQGTKRALQGISFQVRAGERLGVLGPNGAGKSTLIKVLSGMLEPTYGEVHRGLSLSWPLALGGGFEGQLTGYDNIRFLSRVYGLPFQATLDYVDHFSELGRNLFKPLRYYSDGMRMRLAFALSLSINFECYLIDEVILVGDRRFQQKCHDELFSARKSCGMIMAVHDAGVVRDYCQKALLLKGGRGRVTSDMQLASRIYSGL
ncbi:capsular polysaccharide transport system ATP-binding protein [Enhydrobacter aerosaccus]|uniref:Capsular polysaccharide transport system ATP-binding protein n=1 Tax=Enhydrobacter aerosaccus TaxID=225324 RepID=A0A1T4T740_9HYPH|nr:capsular polysaccharide transport system ATP-binding protein [Enhydrobacter aerosaccus]